MTDSTDGILRIAMWSGPRNISTAMMRAWENRPDTAVVDEPFYACYLEASGADHPMREEVLATGKIDWDEVVASLLAPLGDGKRIQYQKHMTHHLLPQAPLDWTGRVANVFLIRHPREVVPSYARGRGGIPTLADLGYARQAQLFDRVAELAGAAPPVLDASDVLADPRRALSRLCEAVGVPFDERMLSWPAGPRPTDGVWAPHWYASVWQSTGFARPRPPREPPAELVPVIEAALPYYERLARYRLAHGET
ncbi:MAG TPA: hypothetical protein VFG91_04800 [Woeseiaceae bacterium]|nr:hypothetical protein [Woeseiaceae bacterium]